MPSGRAKGKGLEIREQKAGRLLPGGSQSPAELRLPILDPLRWLLTSSNIGCQRK